MEVAASVREAARSTQELEKVERGKPWEGELCGVCLEPPAELYMASGRDQFAGERCQN